MIFYLLILFIVVPFVELVLLLWLADHTSWQLTVLIVLATGIIGSLAARRQGLGIWIQVQRKLAAGELPGASIVDGVLVLIAGALLITPGLLTDGVGFALLVPWVRSYIRKRLMRALLRRTEWRIERYGPADTSWGSESGETFDGQAVSPDEEDDDQGSGTAGDLEP